MTVYDFSAKTITGEEKSLKDYKGKALLIVNVEQMWFHTTI